MTGVMGGGVLGTTLFSLASGDVGVLGSLFLAGAGVAGQVGGIIVNDMNLAPFSLASPYDKDGVITPWFWVVWSRRAQRPYFSFKYLAIQPHIGWKGFNSIDCLTQQSIRQHTIRTITSDRWS